MSLRLEVAVDSPSGFKAAIAGGAHRIELCAALSVGGLTPSPGLMRLAAETSTPVRAMIRPRIGGFIYTPTEYDVMRRDIDAVREAGLAGIVIGANRMTGELDEELLRRLANHAQGLEIALHRAIDLTPDPLAAMEVAVSLGFDTILASGRAPKAIQGLETLKALSAQAAARIEIMPGGGITADNAGQIVETTGVNWLHASCSEPLPVIDKADVSMGFITPDARDTSHTAVLRLTQVLGDLSRLPKPLASTT
ncbi:MAG: copper homeostasis protein CutC [Asticcacaulis sp.]